MITKKLKSKKASALFEALISLSILSTSIFFASRFIFNSFDGINASQLQLYAQDISKSTLSLAQERNNVENSKYSISLSNGVIVLNTASSEFGKDCLEESEYFVNLPQESTDFFQDDFKICIGVESKSSDDGTKQILVRTIIEKGRIKKYSLLKEQL